MDGKSVKKAEKEPVFTPSLSVMSAGHGPTSGSNKRSRKPSGELVRRVAQVLLQKELRLKSFRGSKTWHCSLLTGRFTSSFIVPIDEEHTGLAPVRTNGHTRSGEG